MRIIAGSAKGHGIKVPQCTATRPATDRVRSAIFSILEGMDLDWSGVLDLYAGSGALGLEALSRGAERAEFVDQERQCCTVIRQNAETLGFLSRTHAYCGKVSKVLSFLKGPYGLVFLDPPYADDSLPAILEQISSSKLLATNSIIVVLHSARRTLQEQYGRLHSIKQRRHGDTVVSMFEQEAIP